MNIPEIESLWRVDSIIDQFKLSTEALKIPNLHSNYYEIYIKERLVLLKMKESHKELEDILFRFYQKNLTSDELKEYDLEYDDRKVLKPDIPRAVGVHKENISAKLKVGIQIEKVEFLKSIIQQINSRSFHIRDAIEFKKFESGG